MATTWPSPSIPVGFPIPIVLSPSSPFPRIWGRRLVGRSGETTPERSISLGSACGSQLSPIRQLADAPAQNPGHSRVELPLGASSKRMTTSRVLSGFTTVVSRPVLIALTTGCRPQATIPSRFLSSRAASTRSGSPVATRPQTREVVGRLGPALQSHNFLTMPAQEKGQAAGAAGEKKAKKPPPALRPSSRRVSHQGLGGQRP